MHDLLWFLAGLATLPAVLIACLIGDSLIARATAAASGASGLLRRIDEQQQIIESSHRNNAALRAEITALTHKRRNTSTPPTGTETATKGSTP